MARHHPKHAPGRSASRCAVSAIIPAYNERHRLPQFLRAIYNHFEAFDVDDYEVIVVDDGSDDGTLTFLESETEHWSRLSVVRHLSNLGKGAAVQSGMLAARGELLLFADADGATPIEEEAKLRRAIERGADVAVGSRALQSAGAKRLRTVSRRCAGAAFARLCGAVLGLSVRDTQCGFKMFRRGAARRLFSNLTETGFAFDLELLARAWQEGYNVAEVPVQWREMPGSKVRMLRDGPRMVRSLFRIRRRVRTAFSPRDRVIETHQLARSREGAVR